jgi:GNAT superfamily N-acetyltransferase
MDGGIDIRPFGTEDAEAVQELFVRVNRLLAPPHMTDAFERYVARSIVEEIGRIPEYYRDERRGEFFVAVADGKIAGMFGLEPSGEQAMELRRMYVDPSMRRRGIARKMLERAEMEAAKRGAGQLVLSTSELQQDALKLYRAAGYRQIREEQAEAASNKTIGGGIRRFHFEKPLTGNR